MIYLMVNVALFFLVAFLLLPGVVVLAMSVWGMTPAQQADKSAGSGLGLARH